MADLIDAAALAWEDANGDEDEFMRRFSAALRAAGFAVVADPDGLVGDGPPPRIVRANKDEQPCTYPTCRGGEVWSQTLSEPWGTASTCPKCGGTAAIPCEPLFRLDSGASGG